MNRKDRDPITDASDASYGIVAGLAIVVIVVVLLLAKGCGWA